MDASPLSFHSTQATLAVSGKIELIQGRDLQIEFRLRDPENLVLDSLSSYSKNDPFRAHGLWSTTCFEAFWGVPGESGYWELNLSASQPKWNLYRFDSYRQPQPPQESYDFEIRNWESSPTSQLILLSSEKKFAALEASLCAILRTNAGTHFYSSNHAGREADFHLRESLTLKLGKQ